MTIESLKYINDILSTLTNYEFGQWTSTPVPNPYFVGEYNEVGSDTEDGRFETTFILTGTTRGSWLELESVKEKIEKALNKTAILPNGNGIAVFYVNSFIVPVDNAELKRIQINLQIQEWKV
ncbi:hypothetical protein A9CBEGH2_07860 [Amedibacterium intestinale]|uniref:hypothetical protein n=1 Tax=Amedibacterium intestinale TaxID=2583452 RepID=UPI0013743627|nr:hypothetical protein [Amedibacterium intestinale]BBK61846.1 hypothetical protein A9CBEGH2_07860 [Amedibacterium intestinale]